MKRLAPLLALFVLGASDSPLMPESYSLLCSGEKATGFNWRADSWVEAKYAPEDYIVVVSPNNICLGETNFKEEKLTDGFSYREKCFNVRKKDKPYNNRMSGKCTEYYLKSKSGEWEKSFSCSGVFTGDISGRFEGWFHKHVIHENFDSKADYKDSLVVEVGKCTRIM